MTGKQSQKGFTIIEVVLVLAIAALIFLIVFLAVPALQRSQRDTQRRADVSRLHAAITNFASNRQGRIPQTADMDAAWIFRNVRAGDNTESFEDPRGSALIDVATGTQYAIQSNALTTAPTFPTTNPPNNPLVYRFGHRCADTGTQAGAGNRTFAVLVALEGGDFYCQDN